MTRVCKIFPWKRPVMGSKITRRGIAKRSGGIGLKITGKNIRRFLPNLQKVRVILDGRIQPIRVCAKALKAGKVQKAPRRQWRPEVKTT